jgi:hypothetical protein
MYTIHLEPLFVHHTIKIYIHEIITKEFLVFYW